MTIECMCYIKRPSLIIAARSDNIYMISVHIAHKCAMCSIRFRYENILILRFAFQWDGSYMIRLRKFSLSILRLYVCIQFWYFGEWKLNYRSEEHFDIPFFRFGIYRRGMVDCYSSHSQCNRYNKSDHIFYYSKFLDWWAHSSKFYTLVCFRWIFCKQFLTLLAFKKLHL